MTCPAGTELSGGVCLRPAAWRPAEVRAAANRILAQPQFRIHRQSWIERFDSWVIRTFGHLLNAFFSGGTLTVAGAVAAAALLAIAMALAARFAYRVRTDPAARTSTARPLRRRPGEWADEAARHEAAGEWRDAIRCRYRALVADLAVRGVIEEAPGRTTREYERQLRSRMPSSSAAFDEASDMFEAAWYGGLPTGREDGERFQGLAASVLTGAAR